MGNSQRRKGAQHEVMGVRYLQERGFDKARRTKGGDVQVTGDIDGVDGFVFEFKNQKDLAKALRTGVDQAVDVAALGPDYPVAVVKRPLRGIDNAYAVMPFAEMVTLIKELHRLRDMAALVPELEAPPRRWG